MFNSDYFDNHARESNAFNYRKTFSAIGENIGKTKGKKDRKYSKFWAIKLKLPERILTIFKEGKWCFSVFNIGCVFLNHIY